ncbi:MAG: hypothetical protein IJZ98_05440 [Bacteroidales bacterium]|nr:hypothetical protein [Bacteroidales bacterium]
MRKILFALVAMFFAYAAMPTCDAQGRKDVTIPLDLIHTDAAFKQFKKATKMNQLEIINELVRQANAEYKACETIDDLRVLRERVVLINRYLVSGKQGFMSAQMDYNLLYNKINKSIREYEGGTTVYSETSGYYDFGQDVD